MASVGAVRYDAYGPTSAGPAPSVAEPASAGAPAAVAPRAQATVAAAIANPGTVADVIAANVAANGSADLFGAPTPEYSSTMSQVVRAVAASTPKVGGRLDTQM
jgi:hypothetical protein